MGGSLATLQPWVLTCFADLDGQLGQLALQDRLLLLGRAGLLLLLGVAALVAVQRLHLHGSAVLRLGWHQRRRETLLKTLPQRHSVLTFTFCMHGTQSGLCIVLACESFFSVRCP